LRIFADYFTDFDLPYGLIRYSKKYETWNYWGKYYEFVQGG